ncbi:sugar transporter [Lactiplantibacillus garii]|uniref:Sugar transporter n=1 Tax=Lactiplantibacillus garii TaxID=2306423 RepID=A0A3R8J6H4_9LACO|nr:GRP family sugar transporter [Lactiplantibacillus garii]RRK10094.1 sugar transporter [Lactiplantibacillus garii]
MVIIAALIPALCWGLNPLLIRKIDGRPENEMLGMGLGTGLVGLVFFLSVRQPGQLSTGAFMAALVSGSAWAVGQLGQYVSYRRVGVSGTMPVSTALQLIGTAIIGVVLFGEWSQVIQKLLGLGAIGLIVIGSRLSVSTSDRVKHGIKDYLPLLATTVGYWIYSCIPKALNGNATQLFFPQMVGITLVAVSWALYRNHRVLRASASWLNIIPGILYGVAAFTYIIAARHIGITNAYIVGQLSVVISTLGGLIVLRENQQFGLIKVLAGLTFIFIGCITTALI